MDLLTGLRTRTSALKLMAPGPTREQIEQLIRAAVRAPDHGRLRPWRFVVLEGAAREKLGEEMARISLAKFPQSTPDQLDIERRKALRAPTIIAVAARITRGKIPEIEQVNAVAAAAQNLLLAAHAMGLGAMWKTGTAAYDEGVKRMLGLEPEDHIVAFIYVGTIAAPGVVHEAPIETVLRWLD